MSNATCLLALPEFEVTAVWAFIDEAIVHIVMPRREGRLHPLWRDRYPPGSRPRRARVRDLPAGGRAVVLLWATSCDVS